MTPGLGETLSGDIREEHQSGGIYGLHRQSEFESDLKIQSRIPAGLGSNYPWLHSCPGHSPWTPCHTTGVRHLR